MHALLLRGWLLLVLLLLLAVFPVTANAEVVEKGVRLGLDVPSVERDSMANQASSAIHGTGGKIGAYVTLGLSSAARIQLEGQLSGWGLSEEVCAPAPCVIREDLTLWFFEVPVLLRFDLLPDSTKFHVDFGPEIVIGMGGHQVDPMTHVDTTLGLNPANLGVVAGIGVQLGAGPGRIALDVRFQRWVGPLSSGDGGQTVKSGNQLAISLGYAFP